MTPYFMRRAKGRAEVLKKGLFGWKNNRQILIGIISCLYLVSSAYAHSDGPYKGKVIDLDTGNPIEGAVVAAAWTIETWAHTERICDAKETMTDKNGEFELPEGSCTAHPFAKLHKPNVVVFKPGYLSYPPLGASPEERKAQMPGLTGYEFRDEKQYYIIRLGKPKTITERKLTQSHAQAPLLDETKNKLPILINLINKERKNLGLDEVFK